MEITLDIIGGDPAMKMQDEFMHACDVFEKGKRLGEVMAMSVSANKNTNNNKTDDPNPDPTLDETLEKICQHVKDTFTKAGGFALFVAVREIDGKRCLTPHACFEEGIQTISNGNKFGLFKNYLEILGYKAETDEHMHVIKVECAG
jgi:hypothetical protein